jgi:mono/diheme cytochrome c family protein
MKTFHSSKLQFGLWVGILFVVLILIITGCYSSKESGVAMDQKDPKSGSDPKAGGDPSVSQAGAQSGRELFDSIGCMGCHTVNGRGGTVGPNLSDEADKGRSRQWLTTQIRDPRANDPDTLMPSYDNLSKDKVSDLVDYLMTLSGKNSSQNKMPGKVAKTAKSGKGASESGNISLSQAGEKWSDFCGRCHNLRSPSEYSDAQWTVAMDQMRLIVPLTVQEQHEVLKFLKANN